MVDLEDLEVAVIRAELMEEGVKLEVVDLVKVVDMEEEVWVKVEGVVVDLEGLEEAVIQAELKEEFGLQKLWSCVTAFSTNGMLMIKLVANMIQV